LAQIECLFGVEFWNIVEIEIIRQPKFVLDGFSVLQRRLVRIIRDDPNNGITKGQIGTILEVYDDSHFETEICDINGITLFLGALASDILELV
jgi:hypothetical protein